jgi:hypothetical protein
VKIDNSSSYLVGLDIELGVDIYYLLKPLILIIYWAENIFFERILISLYKITI